MPSDKAKNPTPLEKQYIAALLEAGPEGEFGISFMESMKQKVEKGYSLTVNQHITLEELYDKVILGNQTERTSYDFGICTLEKEENSKWLWSLRILGQPYGEAMPKKDALVLANWLAKILPILAEDFKQDDTLADRLISWEEMKEATEDDDGPTEEGEGFAPAADPVNPDDEECPF